MLKLNIGLVGTGYFASKHAKAIKSLKDVKLVGVFSRSKENTISFTKKFKIKAYDSYEAMLLDKEINVIDIVISSKQQEIYTKLAAKAKKHILVAKPIATNVKAAEEMIKICNKNNVLLSVIFPRRSEKIMNKVRSIVQKGKLGDVLLVNTSVRWHRSAEYFTKSKWKYDREQTGGGVLIMQAIHLIDLIQWIIGEIDTVTAQCSYGIPNVNVETSCVATMKFKSGAIGSLSASVSVRKDLPDTLEIHGTKGSIVIQGSRIKSYLKKSKLPFGESIHRIWNWLISWLPCEIFPGCKIGYFSFPKNAQSLLKTHLKEVFANLQKGKSTIDGIEGTHSLKTVESMYKSAELQKEVEVS